MGVRELERQGWPVELRTAILGHAQYSGVPRVTHLDKALFACDELARLPHRLHPRQAKQKDR